MELIYAYIEKYRTFENQEIFFTDKFRVSFKPDTMNLLISRNPEHYDIYPGNIVGITALLGKNSSGKTSLLSLIGRKIEDRVRFSENIREIGEDPFQRSPVIVGAQIPFPEIERVSDYLLLYYFGEDETGTDLFIMETNYPEKYALIFENHSCLTERNAQGGIDIEYFGGKQWLACVFKSIEGTNTYLNDTFYFERNLDSNQNIDRRTAVISFFPESATGSMRDEYSREEDRISLKRRNVDLEALELYKKLEVLLSGIKMDNSAFVIYKQPTYKVVVHISEVDPPIFAEADNALFIPDVIYDYMKIEGINLSIEQKMILEFDFKFSRYVASVIDRNDTREKKDKAPLANDLQVIQPENSSYDNLIEKYHMIIDRLFTEIEQDEITIEAYQKSEEAFSIFLQNAEQANIEVIPERTGLTLIIHPDSDLKAAEAFFKKVLDERVISRREGRVSIMNAFIEADIINASSGLRENLALFASLHEQIQNILPHKKKYILLFDELERSMHPEMCRNLISDLIKFLGQYSDKEFQLIIASHSPFIAGDLMKQNIVCLNKQNGKSIVSRFHQSSFGQNIHTILRQQFFLQSTFGEFATNMILLMDKCLHCDTALSTIEFCNQFLSGTGIYTGKRRINSSEECYAFLKFIVSEIGEVLLRDHFVEQLEQWKIRNLDDSINYT